MKGNQKHAAKELQLTKIKITTDGQRHWGAVIESIEHKCTSKETYIQPKWQPKSRNSHVVQNCVVWASGCILMECMFVAGFKYKPIFCMRNHLQSTQTIRWLNQHRAYPNSFGRNNLLEQLKKINISTNKVRSFGNSSFFETADKKWILHILSKDLAL